MNAEEYVQAAIRTEHTPTFIRTFDSDLVHAATPEQRAHDQMLSRIMHAMLGLMSELGELAGSIKKHLIYGAPLDMVNLVEELGDKDWYRALFADAIGVGLEKSWEINIAKLRARYPDKFTSELALKRDLNAERASLEAGMADAPQTGSTTFRIHVTDVNGRVRDRIETSVQDLGLSVASYCGCLFASLGYQGAHTVHAGDEILPQATSFKELRPNVTIYVRPEK